jgi:predicted dehydrogenase
MSGAGRETRKVRAAVVGTGEFGRNHARVYRELEGAELVGVYDRDSARADAVATEFQQKRCATWKKCASLPVASVAVPTVAHAEVGCQLLERAGCVVESPWPQSCGSGCTPKRLGGRTEFAGGPRRTIQPTVAAVEPILNRPLFSKYTAWSFYPRSLDVEVIYDLMIHDLDILLALVKEPVTELKAVGIPVLTDKVDIAHVRLEFAGGAVANVTASRVSTERVRKMRFFQQHEYISLDYARRDALRVGVKRHGPQPEFSFEKLAAPNVEPLHAELDAFLEAVRTRREPRTNGAAGRAALELASRVMASIQEHGERVQVAAFASKEKAGK